MRRSRERIALQPLRYAVQLGGQRFGLGRRQIQENESAPAVDADRIQMKVLLFEAVGGAQVRGGDQCAVEVVGPLMVGAHDQRPAVMPPGSATRIACGLCRGAAQTRAAMPADIVERPQLALAIAHQQDAFAEHVQHHVIAGIGQFLLAAGRNPLAAEYALLLGAKHLRAAIPARGQGRVPIGRRSYGEIPRVRCGSRYARRTRAHNDGRCAPHARSRPERAHRRCA